LGPNRNPPGFTNPVWTHSGRSMLISAPPRVHQPENHDCHCQDPGKHQPFTFLACSARRRIIRIGSAGPPLVEGLKVTLVDHAIVVDVQVGGRPGVVRSLAGLGVLDRFRELFFEAIDLGLISTMPRSRARSRIWSKAPLPSLSRLISATPSESNSLNASRTRSAGSSIRAKASATSASRSSLRRRCPSWSRSAMPICASASLASPVPWCACVGQFHAAPRATFIDESLAQATSSWAA
jgi:hypothetical protein